MGKKLLQFLSVTALMFSAAILASGQRQSRIGANIDDQRVRIAGNVHPMARPEFDKGQLADSFPIDRMMLIFNKTAAQQADLDTLLGEQIDPASPNFQKWLTPPAYAGRFGMSDQDIKKASDWLASQGFKGVETANSRSFIVFSGTAAQVKATFGTEIHRYVVNGESHFANATNPSLNQGIDGTGQTIAIMGQTDLIPADISTFRSLSGLPATTVTSILVPGSSDPGISPGDIDEANLDLQWAGAVAPVASLIYVNSNDAFNSMTFAIDNNVAPIISISYGGCELVDFTNSDMTFFNNLAQQGNASGITVIGPAGDSGAADCDFPTSPTQVVAAGTMGLTVDFPASSPFFTAIGGTQLGNGSSFWNSVNNSLNGSALSYIPETTWNETTLEISQGGSLAASGGGPSKSFAKPSWQTGPTPADGHRDVPDLSFNAAFDSDSAGYLMCSQGSCFNGFRRADNTLDVVGGTSAGVPVFAGVVALLNQTTNTRQGNVNQHLYQLAAASSDAFHDITSGDNIVPCQAGTPD